MNHTGINDALKKIEKLDALKADYVKEMKQVRDARTEAKNAFICRSLTAQTVRVSKRRFENVCYQIERICREEELDITKKYEDLISKI